MNRRTRGSIPCSGAVAVLASGVEHVDNVANRFPTNPGFEG
jgi:hypothetical protein